MNPALATVITDEDVVAFTEGDCWILAEQLWSFLRATLVVVVSKDDIDSGAVENLHDLDWCHMAVLTDEGFIVDIEGVHTDRAAYLNEWRERLLEREGVDSVLDLHGIYDYGDYETLVRNERPLYEFDGARINEIVEALSAAEASMRRKGAPDDR